MQQFWNATILEAELSIVWVNSRHWPTGFAKHLNDNVSLRPSFTRAHDLHPINSKPNTLIKVY